MAITNFQSIANSQWNTISSQYTAITPISTPSGTNNPNLTVAWYVKSNDSNSFVLMLMVTGPQSVLGSNSETADQINAVCTVSSGNQGSLYYTLNESQGWSDRFNVALEITNTNSQKGKLVFTKGKGQHPGKRDGR